MYRSYKEFNGYSTAFRQWRANSHCRFIHGYALRFKVWFDGELDERNWVVDFGCFKRNGVKDWFKHMFDHTTVVASDDPHLETFEKMDKEGLILANQGETLQDYLLKVEKYYRLFLICLVLNVQ